jgi:hypothetical protein
MNNRLPVCDEQVDSASLTRAERSVPATEELFARGR